MGGSRVGREGCSRCIRRGSRIIGRGGGGLGGVARVHRKLAVAAAVEGRVVRVIGREVADGRADLYLQIGKEQRRRQARRLEIEHQRLLSLRRRQVGLALRRPAHGLQLLHARVLLLLLLRGLRLTRRLGTKVTAPQNRLVAIERAPATSTRGGGPHRTALAL